MSLDAIVANFDGPRRAKQESLPGVAMLLPYEEKPTSMAGGERDYFWGGVCGAGAGAGVWGEG